MLKRILFWIICLLPIMPTLAGPPAWSAWLYNSDSGHILEVASDGTILRELTLPLSQGFNLFPSNVAVSHSGTLLAFIAASEDTNEQQLVVYDAVNQFQALLVNLPPLVRDSISIRGDEHIFNQDDSLLAIGYATEDNHWRIEVYDLAADALAYDLTDEALEGQEIFGADNPPLIPVIQRFEGTKITFSLAIENATDGQFRYSSFDWDIATDKVTPNPIYTTLDNDLISGEMLMPIDSDLPNNAESFFALRQDNSLYVYDSATSAYFPFYNDPERSLFWPRFVQNGQLIFTAGYEADSDVPALFLIQRDGTVISAVQVPGITSVRGLTDGLIYSLETPGDAGSTVSLVYVNTAAGETLEDATVLWTGAPSLNYRIIWARDNREAEVEPFMPWAQLAEPTTIEQE
jgi:hypothetical protein